MENLCLERGSGVDRHDKLPETCSSTEQPDDVRLEHRFGFTRQNLVELFFGKAIQSTGFEDDQAVPVACTKDVKLSPNE